MKNSSLTLPSISVVIPTHNRQASLQRLLDGLGRQTYPFDTMEVVVVSNGCTDGTLKMLREYQPCFSLQIVEQSDLGPGAGRNNGATKAKGEILIFLDDDIEPSPGLVEAHVFAHQKRSGIVVMGYLPPVLEQQSGFIKAELRRWWESKFHAMSQTGHRFTYHDLLSGNFSIRKEHFLRVGGFDTSLRSCFDDLEFGIRLLKSGSCFVYAEEALGYHHESRDLDGLLRRKFQEGLAEVHIGRHHPEVISTLFTKKIADISSPLMKFFVSLVFKFPAAGDWIVRVIRHMLEILEWARLRRPWRFLLDVLMIYWHMRGVSQELKTPEAWLTFISEASQPTIDEHIEFRLDISEGLEVAEDLMERVQPSRARIYYKHYFVASIPPQGGAEPLRGEHLLPILSELFPVPVLRALAMDHVMGHTPEVERLIADSNAILKRIELAHR